MSIPDRDAGQQRSHERWPFIRDVLVCQFKLVLGNLQNFVMVPVSIVAALFDLFSKPRNRQGETFYKVLELGREIDEAINVYGAIGGYHATGATPHAGSADAPNDGAASADAGRGARRSPTVDNLVRRVEDAIVREYRKGGTAASVKAAVDRVLDEMQRKPGNPG